MKKTLSLIITLALLTACASTRDAGEETAAETAEGITGETTSAEETVSEETTAFEETAEETVPEETTSEIVIGYGNNINKERTAYDDGWIYYNGNDDCFYKMRDDGSEKTKLAEHKAYCVNIADGWIYYIYFEYDYDSGFDEEGLPNLVNGGVFKMRLDGSENTQISDCISIDNLYVSDGLIYYSLCNLNDSGGENGIYKMSLDGSEVTRIKAGVTAFYLTVAEDRIYYMGDYGRYGSLYGINTDGTEETLICEEDKYDDGDDYFFGVGFINIAGDWIYCNCLEYPMNDNIYKMRLDGSEKTLIKEDICSYCVNVAGDWIYYIGNYNDVYYRGYYDDRSRTALFKIRLDGTEETFLDDYVHSDNINIIGDWVYYYDFKDEDYCRIRTDGTEKQKL